MKNKAVLILYIVAFFIICTLPLLTMLSGRRNAGLEKRTLAEMPVLISDSRINLEFPHEFNTYYSENFGLRTHLVTAYAALNYRLFNHSVNEKVVAGKHGWLFFNETIPGYKREKVFTDRELYCLYRIMYLQQEYLEKHDIGFIFTIAPNKNSIYGEHMPSSIKQQERKSTLGLINDFMGSTNLSYVNLHDILMALKQGQQKLYHKKDSHWNNYGAMLAYEELMKAIALRLGDFEYDLYRDGPFTVSNDWKGDLEVMLLPSAKHRDMQFYFSLNRQYSYTRPPRSYEDLNIISRSKVNDYRLFMVRDSFANALIPFISNNFGYAHYSRAVPPDFDRLIAEHPDIVIYQIVERNIDNILRQAPVMPAPRRSKPENGQAVIIEDEDVVLKTKQSDKYLKIYGYFNPGKYGAHDREIYIRIYNDDEEHFFEAFPVLDEEFAQKPGLYGFSMLVDIKFSKEVAEGRFDCHIE